LEALHSTPIAMRSLVALGGHPVETIVRLAFEFVADEKTKLEHYEKKYLEWRSGRSSWTGPSCAMALATS
jgi:hypothetical protein